MKKSKFVFLAGLIGLIFLISIISSFNPVLGDTDGTVGGANYQGKLFYSGTITKDVPYPSSLFKGTYETASGSSTYELTGMRLINGEITTKGSQNVGNITVRADKIVHSKYNESGLLKTSLWTENDSDTTLTVTGNVRAGDISGASRAMRLFATSTGADEEMDLTLNLATPMTGDKIFACGLRVNSETFNGTGYSAKIQLLNSSSSALTLGLKEGATDLAVVSNVITFDDDSSDVIMYQATISNMASASGMTSFGSVTSLKISLNADDAQWQGTISIDLFMLGFYDNSVKYGVDYGDQLTTTSDFVLANVSTPSSPNIILREFHSTVTSALDCAMQFVLEVAPSTTPSFDEITGRLTKQYSAAILTKAHEDYEDEFSIASLNLRYVLDGYLHKPSLGVEAPTGYAIYSFDIDSVDQTTLLLNEEIGDAIDIDTSITASSTMTAKTLKIVKDGSDDDIQKYASFFFKLNAYIPFPFFLALGIVLVLGIPLLVAFKNGTIRAITLDNKVSKNFFARLIIWILLGFLICLVAFCFIQVVVALYYLVAGYLTSASLALVI